MTKPEDIRAMRPDGTVERAGLYRDHFGRGHHAIRFMADGNNAAFHSERLVPWEEPAAIRNRGENQGD